MPPPKADERLAKIKRAQLECNEMGHPWVRDRSRSWEEKSRGRVVFMHVERECSRCEKRRVDEFDGSYTLLKRTYENPEEWVTIPNDENRGRPTIVDVRMELFARWRTEES